MNVEAPHDLHGRIIDCQKHARMIGVALQAIAHSDMEDPDRDALYGLGAVARDLANELKTIESAYVQESNRGQTEGA